MQVTKVIIKSIFFIVYIVQYYCQYNMYNIIRMIQEIVHNVQKMVQGNNGREKSTRKGGYEI